MKLFKKLEDIFAGAAMAEEGQFDAARQMVAEDDRHVGRGKSPEPLCGKDCEGLTPPPLKA